MILCLYTYDGSQSRIYPLPRCENDRIISTFQIFQQRIRRGLTHEEYSLQHLLTKVRLLYVDVSVVFEVRQSIVGFLEEASKAFIILTSVEVTKLGVKSTSP